jgi:superfamily II DNA or RNA helicase
MVERPGCGKVENWSGQRRATGFTTGWLREPPVWYPADDARAVALRILEARFGEGKGEDGHGEGGREAENGRNRPYRDGNRVFALADFQEAAVRRASQTLESRRGVVIADSVGLGKTYVALALIEEMLRNGLRVAVFTPAALRREWTRALGRLGTRLGLADVYGLPRQHLDDIAPRHEVGIAFDLRIQTHEGALRARQPAGPSPLPAPHPPHPRRQTPAPHRPAPDPDHFPGDSSRPASRRPFLAWISHERLSRGTYPHARLAGLDLVVVDEAHAFRSPRTRRYRALAELCRGARVVLLTATPVNNSVWDLYFLLRLFAGDGDFRDVGVPDLREAVRAATEAGTSAPPSLLPVLHEVVIRRTRPFLREHYGAIRTPGSATPVRFPRRAAPVPILYSLDGVQPGVDAIVEAIEGLTLAAFRPELYIGCSDPGAAGESDDDGGAGTPTASAGGGIPTTAIGVGHRIPGVGGIAELMRAGLLKRLESSLAAFRASLRRQLRYLDAFLAALDRGRLLRPRDHRALYTAPGDADLAQLVLVEVALMPLPPALDVVRLRRDVTADRDRLAGLLAALGPDDPKLERIIRLLDHELRGEKVLLFTEYRDTARYLWRELVHRGGVALIDGAGAFLGTGRAGRRAVIERFAPRANHVRPPPARERVDLLIATDVLAEGLNLQDAAHLVSYDLPWNPVRLIQRLGRIDRLGSPHETVHPYHFLPDRGLDRALRLLDRLRAKLTAIGRTVGADGAVLGGGPEGNYSALVDRLTAGDPDALDAIERADVPALETMEELRVVWEKATAGAGAHWHAGRRGSPTTATGPAAACVPVEPGRPRRVLVAYRIGTRAAWWVVDVDRRGRPSLARDPDAAAAEILLAALGAYAAGPGVLAPDAPPRGNTPPRYRRDTAAASGASLFTTLAPDRRLIARVLAAVRPKVAERVAMLGAGPGIPAASPGADAARRILAALAAIPGGPEPSLCARADTVLAALARPLDTGTETALRRALDELRVTGAARQKAETLVGAVEAAIGRPGTVPGAVGSVAPAAPATPVELIGFLEARPLETPARG